MAIDTLLPSSRQVFIDFCGPAHFDDYEDPVYPYIPASAEETIDNLAAAPVNSFDTIILSVPSGPRSDASSKTVAALTRLLESPACDSLTTLRIAGSLHVLNDRHLQDTSKKVKVQTLILQEPRATGDSYALAALLHSLEGMTVLHLSLDEKQGSTVHSTFQSETHQTLSKLKSLSLHIKGDVGKLLLSMFGSGSLSGCEELEVCFQGPEWSSSTASALLKAGLGFPVLQSIKIWRSVSEGRSARCDGTPLLPLLSLPTLESICASSENPDEIIEFPNIDWLPSTLKTLDMAYAGLSSPIDLYLDLQGSLASFVHLDKVSLAHSYPTEEPRNTPDGDWEVVRSSAGHPGGSKSSASIALARLANTLEARNVSFKLKLVGSKDHEERAYLAT